MNIDIAALLLGGERRANRRAVYWLTTASACNWMTSWLNWCSFSGLDPQALAATPEAALAGCPQIYCRNSLPTTRR